MTRRELTAEERAMLSEDELIEHDLQSVKIGAGMEDATRVLIRGRIRAERADTAIREQAAAREAVGSAWQDRHRLVFTDTVGRPLIGDAAYRAFRELLTAAGLPMVPFHGLRHSTATALLSAGVPLRVVSDLLGHSGIAITADYYAHVERDLRRDAADAMDRAMGADR